MSKQRMADPRGGHVRLYWEIMDSHAWKALSFSQQALYVAMRRRLTSNSNGNITASIAGLREYGFEIAPSSLASGLRALIAVGLIAVVRPGGWVGRGQVIPTLYRFTDEASHEWPKNDVPAYKATNDWQRFATLNEVKAAIAAAVVESETRHNKRLAGRKRKAEAGEKAELAEKNHRFEKPHRFDSKNGTGPIRKMKPEAISGAEIRIGRRNAELAQSLVH